jgi:HAD superfamily hydrolase (TIGR01490 family)
MTLFRKSEEFFVKLAIFDLDNTLLGGDSDFLWGQFLVQNGIVDGARYERENQRFYANYQAGTLDIYAYLEFALAPLAAHDPTDLHRWREQFAQEWIRPRILPKAVDLLNHYQSIGHKRLIITATNSFVTQPIATLLGVSQLLATEVEMINGRYTGKSIGIPCFQEGKVKRLESWLQQTGHSLKESWFYSDSHNDIPLLSRVTYPVAVDPDPDLGQHAREQGWSIISLRE